MRQIGERMMWEMCVILQIMHSITLTFCLFLITCISSAIMMNCAETKKIDSEGPTPVGFSVTQRNQLVLKQCSNNTSVRQQSKSLY